jgi:hypothetical protein
MITSKPVKLCCGNSVNIINSDKPLRKDQIQPFLDAGYSAPAHYLKIGVVYLEKKGITVTGSYGNTAFHLRVTNKSLVPEFKELLEKAINL